MRRVKGREGRRNGRKGEGKEERLAGGWSLHKSRDKIYVRGVNNHEFFCAITLEEAVCEEEEEEAWKHGRAGIKLCLLLMRLNS